MGRGDNSGVRNLAGILRWVFGIFVVLSAIVFLAMGACWVRQCFANDYFYFYRWNPATRGYTQIRFGWHGRYCGIHGESATALATDDTSVIRSKLGGGNVR